MPILSARRAPKQLPLSKRRGSVQQQFVKAHAVRDQVLCLSAATSGSFDYVQVLEVQGLSYDLKGEEEQRQLNELNQQFLAALDFDIQVLWMTLPLHAAAYLAQFSLQPGLQARDEDAEVSGPEAMLPAEDACALLAEAHVADMERLQAGHTLLSRKIYLVYRVTADAPTRARKRRWLPVSGARQQQRCLLEGLERARPLLEVRAESILRMFSSMHLSGRLLSGSDLIIFYRSCLSPTEAERYPLPPEVLEGLDRPVQLRTDMAVSVPTEPMQAGLRCEVVPVPADPPKRGRAARQQQTDQASSGLSLGNLEDLLAPDAITLTSDLVTIGEEYARVLVVQSFPRVVTTGWLRPLAALNEPLVVSYHLHPLATGAVLPRFQRLRTEHAASQMAARRKGNEVDPQIKVAASDLDTLMEQLASGEERMLQVSMHLLVRGHTRRELDARTERVRAVLHSMLLVTRIARFEQDLGLLSCLPHAHNRLDTGLLLSSRAASSMFLFVSHSQFHLSGVLEGITPQGDPVAIDPWDASMSNANRLILGPPGWGKSHATKALISRLALKYTATARRNQHGKPETGTQLSACQILVIDPEREYGRLARALGGQVIRLAPGSAQHLNPFDLPHLLRGDALATGPMEHGDRLADHVQRLHTLFDLMLADRTPSGAGRLASSEKGLLDRALYESYRRVGITADSLTRQRQAPLLRDLYEVLVSGVCGTDTTELAARLHRYVYGSLAGLFSGKTNVALDRQLIIFDIHDLETELRPIGLFLVSNFVWTTAFQVRLPRLLVVDEAATILAFESGLAFLEDLVRRARKYYLGVILLSQHPECFRGSAIPANCETHVLMRQDATALDLVGQMFKLSTREFQMLRRLPVGEALLLTSSKRLHVRFQTNWLEHLLSTTDPRELAQWQSDPHAQDVRDLLHRLLRQDNMQLYTNAPTEQNDESSAIPSWDDLLYEDEEVGS